jgi:chromate reductase, NAD(P)H dehydrogenase (quinone)
MDVAAPTRILLVSGSTRSGSTNTAALRAIQEVAVPGEVAAELYDGLAGLPAFNPDDDGAEPPAAVAALREQISAAGAVVFCTPEYAGTLPGSFKNLLDWTVGDGGLYGKPVAWINVANLGRGGGAQATLETVLGYVGAQVIEPACRRLPVSRDWVGPTGAITDPGFRTEMAAALTALAGAAGDAGADAARVS